jgi:hypothetical protein
VFNSVFQALNGIPGSGMKFRVGMGMGMGTAENSGYRYTHFWVWPNTRVLGTVMGIALKITRFSCSTMTSTIIRIVFTLKFVQIDNKRQNTQISSAKFILHSWRMTDND